MPYDIKANKYYDYNAVLLFVTECTVLQFTIYYSVYCRTVHNLL